MTDAPDSPPFALPLRFAPDEVYGPEYGWIVDANEYCPWGDMNDKTTADFLIRAVNNYAKMREALKKIGKQKKTDELETACDVEYADFEQGYDDCIDVARTILKEIDNAPTSKP